MPGIQSWVLLCHRTEGGTANTTIDRSRREKSRSQAHREEREEEQRVTGDGPAEIRLFGGENERISEDGRTRDPHPHASEVLDEGREDCCVLCWPSFSGYSRMLEYGTEGGSGRMAATECLSRIHAPVFRLPLVYLFGLGFCPMECPLRAFTWCPPLLNRCFSVMSPDDQVSLGSGLPCGPRGWSFPRNQFPLPPASSDRAAPNCHG